MKLSNINEVANVGVTVQQWFIVLDLVHRVTIMHVCRLPDIGMRLSPVHEWDSVTQAAVLLLLLLL